MRKIITEKELLAKGFAPVTDSIWRKGDIYILRCPVCKYIQETGKKFLVPTNEMSIKCDVCGGFTKNVLYQNVPTIKKQDLSFTGILGVVK